MSNTGRRTLAGILPALFFLMAAWPGEEAAADRVPEFDRAAIKRMAAKIDSIVESTLRDQGLKPNPLAEETTVLRRTSLAAIGRIPTESEVVQYQRESSSDRSYALVDRLLDSKGYASNQFNWWADLLRTRARLANRVSGEPYIHWLKESLEENKPYDQMVHELISAEGPTHKRGNGATGYYMRDFNMPEDNMSNTIRLFLGSRLECAQCHNHPFDKWTQKQYFEMVAFTGGIRYQNGNYRRDPKIRSLAEKAREKWGRNGQRALFRTMQPVALGIFGTGSGAARLPKDYQYDDAKPHDWIEANALFDPPVFIDTQLPDESRLERRFKGNQKQMDRARRNIRAKDVDSRRLFADWLTSSRNDRFATVIANRLWKQTFGRGVVEPIDDIKDDSITSSPELLQYLQEMMVELKFDMKQYQRVLMYTRLWRRAASAPVVGPASAKDLRGPSLRRMRAEQAWDSLLTLVVDDIDARIQPSLSPRTEAVYNRYEKLANADEAELMEEVGRLALRYSDPEKFRQQQREMRNKQRAMSRMLNQQYKRAKREGDTARAEEILAEFRRRGIRAPGQGRAGRGVGDMARAADLTSPAPNGHLVRELGQSPRELIDEGHTDPTVPQVLALLNSFIEEKLLTKKNASLMRRIDSARGTKAKLDTAFLSVLGRKPTSEERRMWERDISKGGNKAVQDLVWTLVNTHEFIFIQ